MRKFLLFTVVLLAFSAAEASAQRRARATATLAVVVTDSDGNPVRDVLVTVEGAASKSARTEAGRIVFEELPAGDYRLRFEHDGYVTLERELTARAGRPTDVKVTLTPVARPAAPPSPSASATPVAMDAKPVVIDLPAFIEKNYIGRGAGRVLPLACATGGSATLIQLNEPLLQRVHSDADEFLYIVAGEGTLQMAGREQRMEAGVFVLVPRGLTHALTATGRSPLVVLSMRAGEACGG